eukprot:TRINITY_DN1874_c0_g1_i5.p1 TRINITY_DN1874_c0_g1~~TRINITY_DN1874_c0_g1_i5.p1  ORF type:complete len:618 (+),score=78.56 TRINITY_DN1874_c0_g1_i5:119-1972(+)
MTEHKKLKTSSVSLRFSDTRAEDEYLRRQSHALARSTSVGIFVQILVGLPFVVEKFITSYTLSGVAGLLAWLGFLFLALGISESQRRFHFLRNSTFELVATIMASLDMLFLCVVDSWFTLKLRGIDPYSTRPYYSDSSTLLTLLGIQVAVHVCLPIRWCRIMVAELTAILVYTAIIVVGSPEGLAYALLNLVMLAGILIVLSIGKRVNEKIDRDAMVDLLDEKTRRVTTEFQLEMLAGQSKKTAQKTVDLESRASTTRTGLAFQGGLSSIEEVIQIGMAEQWFIKVSELRISVDKKLGEGGFGVVYRGTYFGTAVAVKMPLIQENEKVLLQQLNEVRILRHLRHPNIVQFFGALWSSDERRFCIVLELVLGVSLDSFIPSLSSAQATCHETVAACRETRTRLLGDIACALQFLHSRRPSAVVHGDIKGENIFVERHDNWGGPPAYRAKLLDFGLARVLTRNAKRLGGTLRWMAPEVYKRSLEFGPPADVFSFGRVGFFVVTGDRPLESNTVEEMKEMLRHGQFPELLWPEEDPLTQQLRPWIERCTLVDQVSRPTISEVVEAVFMNETTLDVSDVMKLSRDDRSEFEWHQHLQAFQAFFAAMGTSEDTSTKAKLLSL